MAYNARLPRGLEVPAVLHPEAEGGGGRIGGEKASRRKSARKTPSDADGWDWDAGYCGSESGRISAIA